MTCYETPRLSCAGRDTFSATQNNGRIVSSADAVTGENVSYTYDSLNRLIAAATTNGAGPMWSESYSYDEFGNLTAKTGTGGAPSVTPQVNSSTNQASMSGDNGFDLNGNWLGTGSTQVNTWNVENQLVATGSKDSMNDPLTYTYDPWGKRVLQDEGAAICGPYGTVYFYSVTGQLLGTFTGADSLNCSGYPRAAITNYYFGNRLLTPVDRLGSVRYNATTGQSFAYYPWGEERAPGTTDSGGFMFGTYWRDGYLGSSSSTPDQDYAQARYYMNNFGRFWSVDPKGNARVYDPQSWNRYNYSGNDPVNKADPTGLGDGPACNIWAQCDPNGENGPSQGGAGVGTFCWWNWGGGEGAAFETCFGADPPDPASPQMGASSLELDMLKAEVAATYKRIWAAIPVAIAALNSNPMCSGLYNLQGNAPNPATLLSEIASGLFAGAYFTVGDTDPDANAETIRTAYSMGPDGTVGWTGVVSSAVTIFSYDPSTPFNNGSIIANAETILHELGHIYEYLYGPSSTMIDDDSGDNVALSRQNTMLVSAVCFGGQ